MQERKCPVSHLGQLGKHWAWGQVGHQGAATLHSPPPGACCPHLPQVQAGRDTTAPFVDGCSLLSVGPRAGRQREPNRLPTMTRQCPSSVGCLELWTRDSRQPFQVAGVIPILRDKEIFEEGKHPDQAHTASKLQSQDPSLSFLIWATLFSFHGPLSLEKGTVENRPLVQNHTWPRILLMIIPTEFQVLSPVTDGEPCRVQRDKMEAIYKSNKVSEDKAVSRPQFPICEMG
ncbi:uncharacterized protein LOC125965210 isoform X2 [Orcinus orca]|uniref:uncharacterized protein LOC125965210 isoform X2 n=1 Tax=Orcinus orca TaxID=9733 RepID=UPI002112EE94|nr:uncharacterized protein LOC125965210 isoform X2 [Orcinus orca]